MRGGVERRNGRPRAGREPPRARDFGEQGVELRLQLARRPAIRVIYPILGCRAHENIQDLVDMHRWMWLVADTKGHARIVHVLLT